jgi:hypothetical protein
MLVDGKTPTQQVLGKALGDYIRFRILQTQLYQGSRTGILPHHG